MLLSVAVGICPTIWLQWDCPLGRFSVPGRDRTLCRTPAAKHGGADCASSQRARSREKKLFQVKVFFPQIYSCGTGIFLCFTRVCSQVPSAQRAFSCWLATLCAITSEVVFTLVCFKRKTPVGFLCHNSLHFYLLKALLTAPFMADTSCSSFRLIHVDKAPPQGLRVKCVKRSGLSRTGTAEGQSPC